jgi:ppGpp synthetase/RelA/SpoT-type nucleotidyltranferase
VTKPKPLINQDQLIRGILSEYDERCDLLEEFRSAIHRLVLDLLKSNSLRVHSVTSRVKEKQSLSDKITNAAQDKYKRLDDIEDICGHRIITYFPDEVDTVAEIIQNEFEIDYDSSVDKRAILDPDRFGYLSLHYIATLPRKRLRLAEYIRFKKCKTEIQIRSILQHTWAEIEHDLGYKSRLAVPTKIRRRFSQLAGLLELADDTFVQIRDTLDDYESKISDQILKTPETVQIDQASLPTFVRQSEILIQIDNKISKGINASRDEHVVDNFLIEQLPRLHHVNVNNIAELSHYLTTRTDDISKLAVSFLTKHNAKSQSPIDRIYRGVGILYLFYLILVERSRDVTAFKHELMNVGYTSKDATRYSRSLFDAYKQK